MDLRSLHLLGALGTTKTEMWDGREHLVVPVVALMEGVIHAVNARTAEHVPASSLLASVNKWNGHPLVIGHPVKDGRQISAHDPAVLAKHGCGFIRQAHMNGNRLGMEALVDPARMEALGHSQLLADLRAGKGCEVSVGAFVSTNGKTGNINGKAYDGEWTEIGPDHLAMLPGGTGACSQAMGCGMHRHAQAYLVTAEGFEALGDSPGHEFHGNQYTAGAGGASEKASEATKKASEYPSAANHSDAREAHQAAANHHLKAADTEQGATEKQSEHHFEQAMKHVEAAQFHAKATKTAEFAPDTRKPGHLSDEQKFKNYEIMHGTKKANEMRAKAEKKGRRLSMNISDLKARVLALFDSPEQAASEEAAELVKFQTLRDTHDALGKSWDAVDDLIDELLTAETLHVTGAGEEAETELEAAKLDAIRTHCVAMSGSISALLGLTYPGVEPARYAEALRTLIGKRNNASDQKMIQTMHDHATALGAECDTQNVRFMSAIKTLEGKSLDERVQAVNTAVQKEYGSGNGLSPSPLYAYAQMVYDDHVIIRKDEKLYSVDYKTDKDGVITFTGEPTPVKQEYVAAAAAKDCEQCDGTGQIKDGNKQLDCPACGGEGTMKAAATTESGDSAAEEGQMTKEQKAAAIKALTECSCSGFTAADIKTLEGFDDASIERFTATAAARRQQDADVKALQAKQAETEVALKAAQAAQIPAEELTQLRSLAAAKQVSDAAEKAALVTKLAAASKALTVEQLNAKSLDDLKMLAAFAKVDVVDYSVRGIPVQRSAETADSYAPPNPYEAGIKALQSKAVN